MDNPELVVTSATPLPSPPHSPKSQQNTLLSNSPSLHSHNSGNFRSSSEDAAVTIISMYTDKHENWAANTKTLALRDVESMVASHSRSVQGPDSTVPDTHNGTLDGSPSKQPPMGNGHAVATAIPNLPSLTTKSSLNRASEESTSLPYMRESVHPPEPPPLEQPSTPPKSSSQSRIQSRRSTPDTPAPDIEPAPLAEPSTSILDQSYTSQPPEGEDPDAFHIRSTYAQLDASGVRGDGYEEGVELTRAKQGGTTYLTMPEEERNRGPRGDLSSKELAVLASVDRYGFFVAPSAPSDRLLLLPNATLLKTLSSRSSRRPPSSPTPFSLSTLPTPELAGAAREKEISRTAKWGRMLESQSRDGSGNVLAWHVVSRKQSKLRRRVYKGIPDIWRAPAWMVLVERLAGSSRMSQENLARQFRDTLDKPSSYDIQIDLDVPRTISGHVMFRTRYGMGQRALFHVLHAFSLLCPDCGYVQGMGPITATLLCYYEPEKAYAVLVLLHNAYAMHAIFSPGFPGLLESIYVQEKMMQRMLPDVYAALKEHNISSTSYTTKWYIMLFANTVPFQTQLRLWDAFFLEGRDAMVLTAMAILWVFRDQITSPSASFETILSLLTSFFVPESEDTLLKWLERALEDKKLRADMQSWRQEWRDIVSQGKEQTVLL